jgi:hypothetical protein
MPKQPAPVQLPDGLWAHPQVWPADQKVVWYCPSPRCGDTFPVPANGSSHYFMAHVVRHPEYSALRSPTPSARTSQTPSRSVRGAHNARTPSRLVTSIPSPRNMSPASGNETPTSGSAQRASLPPWSRSAPQTPVGTHSPTDDPEDRNSCPGISIQVGGQFTLYPLGRHQDEVLGWRPTGFDLKAGNMTVRSMKCSGSETEVACAACSMVFNSQKFHRFIETASFAPEHTPYKHLSPAQKLDLLRIKDAKIASLHSRVRACCS